MGWEIAGCVGDAAQAGETLAQGAVEVVKPVSHVLTQQGARPFVIPGKKVYMVALPHPRHPCGGLLFEAGGIQAGYPGKINLRNPLPLHGA